MFSPAFTEFGFDINHSIRGPLGVSYPAISAYYASGIETHLEASLGVTAPASRVSAWANQKPSSTGNNQAQATGANQPLQTALATPGGTTVIDFDSNVRFTQTTAATNHSNARYTMFAVVRLTANGNGWMFSSDVAGTVGLRFDVISGNYALSILGGSTLTGPACNFSNYAVICWRLEAAGGYGTALTTKEFYLNGVLQSVAGSSNLTQGTGLTRLGNNAVLAKVAELAIAPGTLIPAVDCVAIMNGLKAKHGL